jgi:hypothetical protein
LSPSAGPILGGPPAPPSNARNSDSSVPAVDFVRVVDERPIDVGHIADYLMEGFDGFLDVVEIKRPGGGLRFWATSRDHGNPIPHTDLIKAITQAHRYLYEIEQEANSLKFVERVGLRAIKPRCTLIFGRSADWDDDERRAYRILNGGYHSLPCSPMTTSLRARAAC